ncbi:hypothetical protein SORBI_3007G147400 [Sorghum bicolor]|uniref:Uncharacterized protein n=1 Tax=Sorghum bicolor TaxID=4558 RepID=A0A1Z5R9Y0_SORBI|nr:hypothetical protein SORBI_3007G147400 [Sorghum bicolor]
MPISISRILFSPYGGAFQFGHYIELPSLASKSKRGKLKSSMVCDQTLDSQEGFGKASYLQNIQIQVPPLSSALHCLAPLPLL